MAREPPLSLAICFLSVNQALVALYTSSRSEINPSRFCSKALDMWSRVMMKDEEFIAEWLNDISYNLDAS